MLNTIWNFFERFVNLFKWWVIVNPWEQAIRVRLGKHVRLLNAGPHWKLPIDKVFVQSTRLRILSMPIQTLTTRDNKTLTLSVTVGYCIDNIEKLYRELHHADDTLTNLTQGIIANYVGTHTAAECEPQRLKDAATGALAFERYGLGSAQVYITDFAFVRTYRLIQDQRYYRGDNLTTNAPMGPAGP